MSQLPVLLALLSFALSEPAAPVRGRAVDAASGAPVVGAEITIVGQRGSARTDGAGRFRWEITPLLPIDVIAVLRDGRVARLIRVTAIDDAQELTLAIEAAESQFVTVLGVAPSINAAPAASATLLTTGDLDLRHAPTLTQALDGVPGVGAISEGQAAVPAVRGLARGRTLIMVDGNSASTERRAGANASFLDPDTVQTIEVARGPGSVAYGSDAFGGVIVARTRGPDRTAPLRLRFAGTVGRGVPERRGDLEISTGYGSGGILVGLRARDFGDYHSPSGVVTNSGWRDRGVRARWDTETGEDRWSVGWQSDFGRSLGRPRSDGDVIVATSPFEDSHRLTASYKRVSLAAFRNLRFDALAGGSRQRTEQDRLPAAGRPRSLERGDLSSREAQLRLTGERPVGPVRLHVGAEMQGRYGLEALDTSQAYNLAGALVSETTTVSVDSARRTAGGLFAEADAQVARRARISGGLRVDAVRNTNEGGFFGNRSVSSAAVAGLLAATLQATPRLTFTGQVARGFRDPTLSDRFYRGPIGRGFIEGNPDLTPEGSLQFDVTARYVSGPIRLAAAAYHYRITSLVERYAATPTLFLFRNRGRAELQGVEIEAQITLPGGLALAVSGEASRGRDGADATPLDDVAPTAAAASVRHRVGAVSSYLRVKAVDSHRAAGPSEVPTDGYTLADAGVSWKLTTQVELRGAMRNLLDDAYQSSAGPRWVWAPGRHGSVTIVVAF
ncbi:MAG: TonB-dependent receptor [Vicinamibacterales bacterium]